MLQWFPNAHFYVNLLWKSRDPRIICRFSLRNKIRGWISLSCLSEFLPGKLKILLGQKNGFMKKGAQHFPHSVLHFLWREENLRERTERTWLETVSIFCQRCCLLLHSNAIRFRIHSYFHSRSSSSKQDVAFLSLFFSSHSHYKYALVLCIDWIYFQDMHLRRRGW